MFNEKCVELGGRDSAIRELNEYGKLRAAKFGKDSVMDLSIGNPSAPLPDAVRKAIIELANSEDETSVHGYTSKQGLYETRKAVSDGIYARFEKKVPPELIYMTCGASAGLAILFKAMAREGDEFVLCAPYFTEYPVYVEAAGAKSVTAPFDENFDIDLKALEAALSPATKAVVINSPNNPSGKIYSADIIKGLAELLERKSAEFGAPIYIISDEPYRELVYGGEETPYIMNYYANSIVCYSYSKALSLAGERIGYVAICPEAQGAEELFTAVKGAGRALGYVCAPSMFQRVIALCESEKPNISSYRENRDMLYDGLREAGFECASPDGAFYLFVKAPNGDSSDMSRRARELGLMIVPGDEFAARGYCRIAYCVQKDVIERALPLFKKLFESYGAQK